MHGKNLILYLQGTPVAASKTCTLDLQTSLLSVSSPFDGTHEAYVADRQGWTVQTDCLLIDPEQLVAIYQIYQARQPIGITVQDTEEVATFVGTAFIERLQVTGSIKQIATLSISLRGTGLLSINPEGESTIRDVDPPETYDPTPFL